MNNIITIKINNSAALKLLENLEAMNIIEILKKTVSKSKSKSIGENLRGSITPENEKSALDEINQLRKEWERDI